MWPNSRNRPFREFDSAIPIAIRRIVPYSCFTGCSGPVRSKGFQMTLSRLSYLVAIAEFSDAMRRGADPAFVARHVQRMIDDPATFRTGVALSHAIEDKAFPGTFAEAVFDILCNG